MPYRADAEQKIWLQIKTSANSQLSKLAQAHESHFSSRNAKKPPEEWFPLLDAVDERWRDAAQLARSTSALDTTEIIDTATQELLKGVELHVSSWLGLLWGTEKCETDVDHRYAGR